MTEQYQEFAEQAGHRLQDLAVRMQKAGLQLETIRYHFWAIGTQASLDCDGPRETARLLRVMAVQLEEQGELS